MWRVLGIEESDGERCECCGTCCPKRRIVLTNGEQDIRYGSNCAAMKLLGSKKPGKVKIIVDQAQAANLARKWLQEGHTPEIVARGIWNRFGYSTRPITNGVDINTIGIITQG